MLPLACCRRRWHGQKDSNYGENAIIQVAKLRAMVHFLLCRLATSRDSCPGTQTTVLLQWVMGDVWYQDNLEYLSDLLTPYPLPPPFYCIFGVYIFFTFWKSVGRGLHGLKEATPLGGVQLFTGGGGGGGAIAYSLYPYHCSVSARVRFLRFWRFIFCHL